MQKKRLFYLDFIRAISTIIIVTYHFAITFLSTDIPIINVLSDGKWGLIGVAMFFMISGASLMYNYGEKIELKSYYKKRFLGIYPMFWIAYSLVFLYIFYRCKAFFSPLPIYKLGISFLAMDGYLGVYTDTICLVGEWFVGCIILIYILFPALRTLMKKHPKILLISATILNLVVILFSNFKMPLNENLVVSIYGFLLGMYFMEYVKECKIWYIIISSIISIAMFNISTSNMREAVLISNFIGYNLFIVLSYIGEKIKPISIQNIVKIISKYSYAIFLLHHYIILTMEEVFRATILNKYSIICVYLICWIIIGVLSKILYSLNKKVIGLFKAESSN